MWFVPLDYDFLAFVPQIVIGDLSDKHPRFPSGICGVGLLFSGLFIFPIFKTPIALYNANKEETGLLLQPGEIAYVKGISKEGTNRTFAELV